MKVEYDKTKSLSFGEFIRREWNFLTDFEYWKPSGRLTADKKTILVPKHRPLLEKFSILVTTLFVDLVYTIAAIMVLTAIFNSKIIGEYSLWGIFSERNFLEELQLSIQNSLASSFFYACILAPIIEEPLFRWYWTRKKLRNHDEDEILKEDAVAQLGRKPIYPVIIVCNIIFGFAHGGPINLFFQGIGGFLLSYTYLRNGRCIWSSIFQHSLYNAAIIFFEHAKVVKGISIAITWPVWIFFKKSK